MVSTSFGLSHNRTHTQQSMNLLAQICNNRISSRVAIIDADGTRHTYGQIDNMSHNLANQICHSLNQSKDSTIAGYNLPSSMFVVRISYD